MAGYKYQGGEPHKPKAKIVLCGTPSGYRRHKRLGEEPCDDCRQANSDDCKAYRAKQRNSA